jgi:rod shape-determining protein MreC
VALIVAVVAAAAFLLGDRRETLRASAYDQVRRTTDRVTAPAGKVLSAPVHWLGGAGDYLGSYIDAANENRRLKDQIATDDRWRDEALRLREENARYRALMGVKTDPPIPMVFARTLTDARGPFSNTRLADAGSDKGVIEGNPVLAEHGLVGRVTGVAPGVARIMLLTDTESRTPVMVARTNARAILTGDGGPTPKMDYLRSHDPLVEGDRVTTSGDGGVYPRGLPVGVVVKDLDGGWRVALDADASPIDYVQILLFRDFAQLTAKPTLEPKVLPTTRTEAPAVAGPLLTVPSKPKPPATAASAATPAATSPAKPEKPKAERAKPAADGAKPAADGAKPAAKPPVTAAHPAKPHDATAAPPKPVADAAHKPAAKPAAPKPKPATPHAASDAPKPTAREDAPY